MVREWLFNKLCRELTGQLLDDPTYGQRQTSNDERIEALEDGRLISNSSASLTDPLASILKVAPVSGVDDTRT